MKRILFLVILLPLFLGACSKTEEVAPAQEEEQAAATAAPEEQVAKPGDMVEIPAGEFIMGNDKKGLAAPAHKVDLPAYKIDVFEVTYGQWLDFTTESDYVTESNWRQFYTIGKEDFPVANVTLDDAKAYAKWAGKRLPTEAEWEKAARGTDGFDYPWGNKWDPTKANCGEYGMNNTVKVGQMESDVSPFGVHDMMGNVQEWTSDKLKAYPKSPVAGDSAFRGNYYVVRGASYVMFPSKGGGMYLWTRSGYLPKAQYGLGFRCAQDIEQKQEAMTFNLRQLALSFADLKGMLNPFK